MIFIFNKYLKIELKVQFKNVELLDKIDLVIL